MSVAKGNIVTSNHNGNSAIVLAVTKDGKRARIYAYGPDVDMWVPITRFTVDVAGEEVCYKCAGSGLFYMGGMVLNGRYTGKTGPCFGCEGKGRQTDADRLRCHYYWHRQSEIDERVEAAEQGKEVKPLSTPLTRPLDPNPQMMTDEIKPAAKPKVKIRSKVKAKPPIEERAENRPLIDCRDCGTLHRSDIPCPW